MARDPLIDPQPGDCVMKKNKVRLVRKREGSSIVYVLVRHPKDYPEESFSRAMSCWITTWQEWCRTAKALPREGGE